MWSHSGREIFYQSPAGEMMAVEIVPSETFAMGARRVLFSTAGYRRDVGSYDVTNDDQRFVMIGLCGGGDDAQLVMVENFFEELKAKVGGNDCRLQMADSKLQNFLRLSATCNRERRICNLEST